MAETLFYYGNWAPDATITLVGAPTILSGNSYNLIDDIPNIKLSFALAAHDYSIEFRIPAGSTRSVRNWAFANMGYDAVASATGTLALDYWDGAAWQQAGSLYTGIFGVGNDSILLGSSTVAGAYGTWRIRHKNTNIPANVFNMGEIYLFENPVATITPQYGQVRNFDTNLDLGQSISGVPYTHKFGNTVTTETIQYENGDNTLADKLWALLTDRYRHRAMIVSMPQVEGLPDYLRGKDSDSSSVDTLYSCHMWERNISMVASGYKVFSMGGIQLRMDM